MALPLGGEWAVAVDKYTFSNTTLCVQSLLDTEGAARGSQQRQHLRPLDTPASAAAPGIHDPGWREHRE